MKNLEELNLTKCKVLEELPDSIGNLSKLKGLGVALNSDRPVVVVDGDDDAQGVHF